MTETKGPSKHEDLAQDRVLRLNSLYYITDKKGNEIIFNENPEQKDFRKNMWYLNCILKARQLGFTTWIQIFMLDVCWVNVPGVEMELEVHYGEFFP